MWLRIRQICLVAEKLAPVESAICEILGVKVCFRDEHRLRMHIASADPLAPRRFRLEDHN